MGRETALAVLLAGLGAVAAVRSVPPAAGEPALPCVPSKVGKAGALAVCGGPGTLSGGERRVLGLPLELNVATASELEALPGIGPALAARVVADRAARGPFATVADLARVRGIGPGKLRLLRGRVTARAATR